MRVTALRPALGVIASIGALLTAVAVALSLTGDHVEPARGRRGDHVRGHGRLHRHRAVRLVAPAAQPHRHAHDRGRLRVLHVRADGRRRLGRLLDRAAVLQRLPGRLAAHAARVPDRPARHPPPAPVRRLRLRRVRSSCSCSFFLLAGAVHRLLARRCPTTRSRSTDSPTSRSPTASSPRSSPRAPRHGRPSPRAPRRAATRPARRAIGPVLVHRPRAPGGAHRAVRDPGRRQLRPGRRDRRHPGDAGLRRAAVRLPGRASAQPLVACGRGRRARRAPRGGARVAHRDAGRRDGGPDAAPGLLAARARALRRPVRADRGLPGDEDPRARRHPGRARRRAHRRPPPRPVALRGARARQRGRGAPLRSRWPTSVWRPSCARGWRTCSESRARLIETGLAERQRLERDLHDGAQQRLVALSLQVHVARAKLTSDPERGGRASSTARATSCGSRSRSCASSPAASIPPCSPTAGSARRSRASRRGSRCRCRSSRPPGATPHGRRGRRLLRGRGVPGQHGQARGRVVRDRARRAAERRRRRRGPRRRLRRRLLDAGSGLKGLADRLAGLDGRLEVVSPPGEGTTVRARIPCESS